MMNLDLAYEAAGMTNPPDSMRRAHILAGLKGKAKRFLEMNSELRAAELKELVKKLKAQFDKTSNKGLFEISLIRQGPDESVAEYKYRLTEAARVIKDKDPCTQITANEAIKDLDDSKKKIVEQVAAAEMNAIQNTVIKKFIFPYFLRGLREELKSAVRASRPQTLDEAIKVAEEQESFEDSYGGSAMAHLTIAENVHRKDPVKEAAQRLQALNKGSAMGSANGPRVHTSNNKPPGRALRGPPTPIPRDVRHGRQAPPPRHRQDKGRNYMVYDKPNALPHVTERAATPRPKPADRCYFCARPGHYAKECLTRARYLQKSMEDVSSMDAQASMQRGMSSLRRENSPHPQEHRGQYSADTGEDSQQGHSLWMLRATQQAKNGERPHRKERVRFQADAYAPILKRPRN